jgi:hypothetical protein
MVGVSGFEPPTSWSQTMRASPCATPRLATESLDYLRYYSQDKINSKSTNINLMI